VPPVVPPYVLEVKPGDATAAKGRSLTLTARVLPTVARKDEPLPATATLTVTDAEGKTERLRMIVDRQDAFSRTIDRLAGSLTYRVEAGIAVSDDFTVTAVEPVELAAGSPTVTVTPPEYARKTVETQTASGPTDLTVLQHGTLAFDLKFSRPAVSAPNWSGARPPSTARTG
jgi:hypothetical protein